MKHFNRPRPCPPRHHNRYRRNPYNPNDCMPPHHHPSDGCTELKDYGGKPFVINIEEATLKNDYFRLALWTDEHLQVTLMSIPPGEDIGLEVHPNLDQFIRIEQGQGVVQMGPHPNHLNYCRKIYDDMAIMVPGGTWHNITNTGSKPLKLYSIYAPPEHPFGTVHKTKEDAEEAEHNHGHKY